MENKVNYNTGKWFDAKKTAELFLNMQNAAVDYCKKSEATGVAYQSFVASESFMGKAADETKNFIGNGMGSMNIKVADEHKKCIQEQIDILDGFRTMVDSSPYAYIDYDVLEAIDTDFVGYHGKFGKIAGSVDLIIGELNKEFGEKYGEFPEPNKGGVNNSFADFCSVGGNGGYVKECQNKFVAFDSELTDHVRAHDTEAFNGEFNQKIANATNSFNNADATPEPLSFNNYKTIKMLGHAQSGQVDPDTLYGLEYGDNMMRVLREGGYTDEQIEKMNYIQRLMAASNLAAASKKNPKPLDAFGDFGADQGLGISRVFKTNNDIPININDPNGLKLFMADPNKYDDYIIPKDKEQYGWIKQIPGCRNLTDAEILREMINMKQYGCSYMFPVNIIFDAYAGDEEGFLKKFGFPMKNENGELNYELLEIYYFLAEENVVHLDCYEGVNACAKYRKQYYEIRPNEYKQKYGTDFAVDSDNGALDNNCLKEAEEIQKSGVIDYRPNVKIEGEYRISAANKLDHFMKKNKIMDVQIEDLGLIPDSAALKKALDNGGKVFLGLAGGFVFEDYEGITTNDKPIDHAVELINISDDGRFEISTNGRRLFYDPQKNAMRGYGYDAFSVNYKKPLKDPENKGQWNIDHGIFDDVNINDLLPR